jgi:hypothetical protein
VPSELLEAFGAGGGRVASTQGDGAVKRAIERLAEHRSQVDQMIQHEQSRAESSGGDRWSSSDGRGDGDPAAGDAGQSQRSGTTAATASQGGSAGGRAQTGATGAHPPPPDVGDGRDDDTLAAQLRELATKEEDPELRERYWEEYRKHKGLK